VDSDCSHVSTLLGSSSSLGSSNIPERCFRPWCFVDAMECMGGSSERVFRSKYFPADSDVDLFYSSSTCSSSSSDWESSQNNLLGGESMIAITAAYNIVPYVYKRDPTNGVNNIPVVPGEEYYNNTIPHEGVHINYVRALQKISVGDFTANFVHGSKASITRVHPGSPGNAAVQDVADGLVDIAVGPIWITGDRLKMTTFTMPVQQDRTVLVTARPGKSRSFIEETEKVLDPFTHGVWFLLIGMIFVTALLSVWFSGKRSRRPSVYARLAVDEFLHKGTFFCSAGVEQDESASLPRKLLMFGFAFFILIAVSAYVANLAAFLTRSGSTSVDTFEIVVARGLNICAHPALAGDLKLLHPKANFVFNQEGKELYGLVDDYDAGKCDVLAVGKMDSLGDLKLMDLFCERDLVFTESLIMENPVGFPIRSKLASGFSYWMYQGEKYHDINIPSLQDEYNEKYQNKPTCNVMLSEQGDEGSEYTQIDVSNLIFPLMFFLGFATIGAILQCYSYWAMEKAKKHGRRGSSLLGTHSTLNLMGKSRILKRLSFDSFGADKNDSEEQPPPAVSCVSLPTIFEDSARTIGTGTFASNDSVRVDSFCENRKGGGGGLHYGNNGEHHVLEKEDENLFSDLKLEDPSLSHLLGKLDDIIECYQEVKRQKKRG